MARLKEIAVGRGGDALYLDPDMIEEIEGYNSRQMDSEETVAYIRRMADSIKANGTISFPPITVRQIDGKIFVYAGHCRRRAFSLAKKEGADIKGILSLVVNKAMTDSDLILDILTSNDGLPLKPLEKANAVNRLIRCGWSTKEIACKLGWSQSWVNCLVSLLNSPKEVKDMVTNGTVAATTAVDQVKKNGSKATDILTAAVTKAKKSGKTRATQQHIRKRVPEKAWKNLYHAARSILQELERDTSDNVFDAKLDNLSMALRSIDDGTYNKDL